MGVLPVRSLRDKLALLFFAIIAGAFGVIFLVVVPQLESKLEGRRLHDLRVDAATGHVLLQSTLASPVRQRVVDRRVRFVADITDARVTLLRLEHPPRRRGRAPRDLSLVPVADSSEADQAIPRQGELARRALQQRRPQNGLVSFGGEKFGIVAQPLRARGIPVGVAVYTRDLDDVTETVAFVRKRVLIATGVALLLALSGAFLAARALARRVERLEVAAGQVAEGRHVDPLPEDSHDELGQLTRTFNEMQLQLRRVDVARRDFIATASHELRTPIFSLAGFVELLQDEDLDEETRREFLETMAEQVARLQKLSVDLLDLSRLDTASLDLHREPVDLAELARSVGAEFAPALAEHRTRLELELPDEPAEASCDRERAAQIVRILMDNALRHTPEGTPVTMSAGRRNGNASLTVVDGGPGLSIYTRAHAFDRFFTGDAVRGAGLGLAIARELAELMDGELRLADRDGGASFTLELPANGDRA
jgi:signal transduction histidine kinase